MKIKRVNNVGGRPRKPLVGGHKNRTPRPTEEARLKQAVRDMSTRHVKTPAREPASQEHRDAKSGKLKKGHHQGRGKGSTNKVPSGIRASVKAILEDVVSKRKKTVRSAIVGGLTSGPRHADRYLRLAADYLDGKPTDNINLNARFNQDELSSARELLGKKLDGVLTVLLKRDDTHT